MTAKKITSDISSFRVREGDASVPTPHYTTPAPTDFLPARTENHIPSEVDSVVFEEDTHALSALYERFRRPIHSYIYRLLGNQEDADDLTQEVFVRVFTAWDGLRDRDNLSAWLYRIASNLSVDLLRRRKRISWWPLVRRGRDDEHFDGMTSDDNSFLPPDSGGIPEVAEREHIRMAVANMPSEYAVALVLHAAQGISYQEVAAIVGISPNAAATRISRAKKMFAEQYQRLSGEGSVCRSGTGDMASGAEEWSRHSERSGGEGIGKQEK